MNPTTTQFNSGIGAADKYGNAINIPFKGTQIPSMIPTGMASTNPTTNVPSPAVISNQRVKDKVVDMTNKTNILSVSRGMTSDGQTTKYADGTIYQDNYQEPTLPQGASPIYGSINGIANRIVGYQTPNSRDGNLVPTYFDSNSSTPAQSQEEKQISDLLSSMKASTDANTASTISSIQSKFDQLRQQQKQINAGQEAQVQNALLTGGVTGKGSASQYTPISSVGIVTSQMNYGVQQLAKLDAEEQDLINKAKTAGADQNFKIMEKSLALVDEKRKEKQKIADELNKKLIDQQVKAREAMIQATRDNALADLLSQGVTDPKDLIDILSGNGGDFTLKEINEGMKNIANAIGIETSKLPAKTKEFFALKERGELPDSILALPTESEQLNAYLRNQAIASKIYAPTKGKAPTTYKSGGLVYSPTDFAEDSKALEASRGADNYVNSEIYANLYKAWVANGGLLKDFIAKFPPKNYVNPKDESVPIFLRPAVSKAKSTVDQL